MTGSTCFFYASGQCVIFSNTEPSVYRPDSTRIQPGDVWIDVNNGMIRTYKQLNPPGFTGWQPMGVMGDSNGDPVNFDQNVALDIVDLQAVATAYPHLCFKSLDPTLTTTDPKYTIVMNNGNLYFRLGSITGSNVMTLTSTGNVEMTGDLDDISNIYLRNHIHHYADTNTRIGFPANDQIELRTGGTNRIEVTDSNTTISNSLLLSSIPAAQTSDVLYYDSSTKSVSYGPPSGGGPGYTKYVAIFDPNTNTANVLENDTGITFTWVVNGSFTQYTATVGGNLNVSKIWLSATPGAKFGMGTFTYNTYAGAMVLLSGPNTLFNVAIPLDSGNYINLEIRIYP